MSEAGIAAMQLLGRRNKEKRRIDRTFAFGYEAVKPWLGRTSSGGKVRGDFEDRNNSGEASEIERRKVNYAISFQWEDKLIGLIVGEILDFKEIIALPNPDSVSSTSSKCEAGKGDCIPSRFKFCRLDLRPVAGKELQ